MLCAIAAYVHSPSAVLYHLVSVQIIVFVCCAVALQLRNTLLVAGHPQGFFASDQATATSNGLQRTVLKRSPWMACAIGAPESARHKLVQWYERRFAMRRPTFCAI